MHIVVVICGRRSHSHRHDHPPLSHHHHGNHHHHHHHHHVSHSQRPQEEYTRLGLPNGVWALSTINRQWELCPTYPRLLAVPAALDDQLIMNTGTRTMGLLMIRSLARMLGSLGVIMVTLFPPAGRARGAR
jgi:hypothetical protein